MTIRVWHGLPPLFAFASFHHIIMDVEPQFSMAPERPDTKAVVSDVRPLHIHCGLPGPWLKCRAHGVHNNLTNMGHRSKIRCLPQVRIATRRRCLAKVISE